MTTSTNQKFDLAAALKGQQWERCKGELRAMVALQGSYHSMGLPCDAPSYEVARLENAQKIVEDFITKFEYEGCHE